MQTVKNIFLSVLLLLTTVSIVFADEVIDKKKSTNIKNPFIPQLPAKVKEVPKVVKKVEPKTSVNAANQVKKPAARVVAKPTPPPAPVKPQFRVTGILWNSDRPQAIINGIVVDVDDKVGQYQIKSIHPEGIEVLIDGITMMVDP